MKSLSWHNISIDIRSQYVPDKRMHPQDWWKGTGQLTHSHAAINSCSVVRADEQILCEMCRKTPHIGDKRTALTINEIR